MGQKKSGRKGSKDNAQDGSPSGPERYTSAGETEQNRSDRYLKYVLYQRAVQSPKGDISYLVRFYMDYVGGRAPLHLHEDFCGSALICTEWLKADPRRTAVGLDLDEEALTWGARNNLSQLPDSGQGRALLLRGNVLNSLSSAQRISIQDLSGTPPQSDKYSRESATSEQEDGESDDTAQGAGECRGEKISDTLSLCAKADIICAFNFSTCCLHSRADLIKYFRGVVQRLRGVPQAAATSLASSRGTEAPETQNPHLDTSRSSAPAGSVNSKPIFRDGGLSGTSGPKGGGVFAMDLYGGLSSECYLKIQRKYGDFDYTWEQEKFDAVTRTTSIALHFRIPEGEGPGRAQGRRSRKKGSVSKRVMKRAFAYQWRLWTIPEVHDCMREAGFDEIKVWMRSTSNKGGKGPDEDEKREEDDREEEEKAVDDREDCVETDESSEDGGDTGDMLANSRVPFKEVSSFEQCDSWNAYVVGVCHAL